MNKEEILQLARLLVQRHNEIAPNKNNGFYKASMERALIRDTYTNLYANPFSIYVGLVEIQNGFDK